MKLIKDCGACNEEERERAQCFGLVVPRRALKAPSAYDADGWCFTGSNRCFASLPGVRPVSNTIMNGEHGCLIEFMESPVVQ